MSETEKGHSVADIDRLLAAAAQTMASGHYCWLVTRTGDGAVASRPMGRIPPDAGEDAWTIRFLTDGRSRKASELRRSGRATVLFQREDDDAYVALTGAATLRQSPAETSRRWKRAYDTYFPSTEERANAAFVTLAVERMELWIRGATPEPFGLQTTVLERDAGGIWRLLPAQRQAA